MRWRTRSTTAPIVKRRTRTTGVQCHSRAASGVTNRAGTRSRARTSITTSTSRTWSRRSIWRGIARRLTAPSSASSDTRAMSPCRGAKAAASANDVLALRFLGHFVGDLHQPLHVGFAEDFGGNGIDVRWDRHRHHQQEPAQRLGFGDSAASGADQSDRGWSVYQCRDHAGRTGGVANVRSSGVGVGVVQPCSDEEEYARRPAGDGERSAVGCINNAAAPIVEQLKKAGVRLAHLINAAAAGTLPVNMLQLTP